MNDPFAPLRARFLGRAATDLAALKAGGADQTLVHRLAGAAGMFGYHEISRLAAVLDDRFVAGEAPGDEEVAALVAALEALPPG